MAKQRKYTVQVRSDADAPWENCDDCSGPDSKSELDSMAEEANATSKRLGFGVEFRVIEAGADKTQTAG